jgi:hypothetical protein
MRSSGSNARLVRRGLPAITMLLVAGLMTVGCRPGGGVRTTTTTTTMDPGHDPDPGGGGGSLPPVTSTTGNGPYAVTIDASGGNSRTWRPTNLGANGVKHPIFVWGTGSTAQPSRYDDHFRQMASHGIVVISPNSAQVNATLLINSKNWIVRQNTTAGSVYYGKLDTSKIAMGGHSLGSTSTFNAERQLSDLTTTIHIAGGSFDGQGSSAVKTPTAYICGQTDIAKTNCDRDFANMRTGGPMTYYAVMSGVDHIQAARRALPAMIAWLRWHLAGETKWKSEFTNGQFTTGIFQAQRKNWN